MFRCCSGRSPAWALRGDPDRPFSEWPTSGAVPRNPPRMNCDRNFRLYFCGPKSARIRRDFRDHRHAAFLDRILSVFRAKETPRLTS